MGRSGSARVHRRKELTPIPYTLTDYAEKIKAIDFNRIGKGIIIRNYDNRSDIRWVASRDKLSAKEKKDYEISEPIRPARHYLFGGDLEKIRWGMSPDEVIRIAGCIPIRDSRIFSDGLSASLAPDFSSLRYETYLGGYDFELYLSFRDGKLNQMSFTRAVEDIKCDPKTVYHYFQGEFSKTFRQVRLKADKENWSEPDCLCGYEKGETSVRISVSNSVITDRVEFEIMATNLF